MLSTPDQEYYLLLIMAAQDTRPTAWALRRLEPRKARHQLLHADAAEANGDLDVVTLVLDVGDRAEAELLVAHAHAVAEA